MELDKIIKEGKRPLTCFDVEIAKQFIGKEGYFSHYIDNYADLENTVLGTLGSTGDTYHESFVCTEETSDNYYYEFFMPSEWVEEEKKYRPYSLAEWIDKHEIGEVIHCRNEHKQEFNVMYTGYVIDNGEDIQDIRTTGRIMLINMGYLLQELFERYEICINGEWQPFGVEVKE
jgi:hypothetical protein